MQRVCPRRRLLAPRRTGTYRRSGLRCPWPVPYRETTRSRTLLREWLQTPERENSFSTSTGSLRKRRHSGGGPCAKSSKAASDFESKDGRVSHTLRAAIDNGSTRLLLSKIP